MSVPRPAATRFDATAVRFLNAGAEMIDAALGSDLMPLPARLKSFQFPAALEWLRVEDILRVSKEDGEGDSKRAFRNRWPAKDDFLRDVVVYALLYRDTGLSAAPETRAHRTDLLDAPSTVTFSERLAVICSSFQNELLSSPRSYLLAHIALVPDWRAPEAEFDAVLLHGEPEEALAVQYTLVQRPGPIVGLTVMAPGTTTVPLERSFSDEPRAPGISWPMSLPS